MDIKEIGLFLFAKRKEKGLTQNDLADLLNVSHQAVSRWERGENLPDVIKLVELAKLYDISVDDILVQKDNVIDDNVSVTNHKESNYMIFTILNVVISALALFLFYMLVLSGSKLWVGIMVHYIIAISSSLLYILPFILNEDRSNRMFKLLRLNIVVSTMLLFLPVFGMFIPLFGYGYLNLSLILIDLIVGYVVYYSLVLVEQKIYNCKVESVLIVTKYITAKRLVELFVISVIGILIVFLGRETFHTLGVYYGLLVTAISFSIIVYYIIRKINAFSILQFLWFGFTLYIMYWWTTISNVLENESQLERLVGQDETFFLIIFLSLIVLIILMMLTWKFGKVSFRKYKRLNIQLLFINIFLFITYSISRPRLHIETVTETQGGITTSSITYVCENFLENNILYIAIPTVIFALVMIYDDIITKRSI